MTALPVASSGIAAILLDGGVTAHSKFKIPIQIHEDSVCSISLQSNRAQEIKEAKIIIWDEASMAHKFCFETLDRFLRDLMKTENPNLKNIPFGGKIILIGGDFWQTLPVVHRGSRADIINATIKSSYLWTHVRKFQLISNMRLANDSNAKYKQYLVDLGEGNLQSVSNNEHFDLINLPNSIWLPLNKEILFNRVYDDFINNYDNIDYINKRAILCPLNKETDEINDFVTNLLPGSHTSYLSIDSIVDQNENNNHFYVPEYLNNLNISGLPPHDLKLKINHPVILMRNISNQAGLCNGTRLIIKGITLFFYFNYFLKQILSISLSRFT